MSVHGKIIRSIDLCSITWSRHIPEQGPTSEMLPGWHLDVTLPFINVSLSDNGANLKQRLRTPSFWADRRGVDLHAAGLTLSLLADNGNTGELGQTGDCTVLG